MRAVVRFRAIYKESLVLSAIGTQPRRLDIETIKQIAPYQIKFVVVLIFNILDAGYGGLK